MKKLLSVLSIVILLAMSTAVMAGDGNGGGNAQLKLESSSVEDGQSNVAVDSEIKLVFSNNVVNMKVKDNNLASFTLIDGSGNDVAIEVVMGDDQVNKDVKNDIGIKPVSELKAGETYTLTISDQLVAKNGSPFGQTQTITFVTSKGGSSTMTIVIGGIIAIIVASISFVITKKKMK